MLLNYDPMFAPVIHLGSLALSPSVFNTVFYPTNSMVKPRAVLSSSALLGRRRVAAVAGRTGLPVLFPIIHRQEVPRSQEITLHVF